MRVHRRLRPAVLPTRRAASRRMRTRRGRRCPTRLCSGALASRRAVGCPVPALGQTAPGCESTPVVVTTQRRVHPAVWPQPDGSGGQMRSRLSSSRSFVFHRSGLRWEAPPTLPSADFSTVFRASYPTPSFGLLKHWRDFPGQDSLPSLHKRRIYKMHPNRRWRASRSRARSPRMHHASYPVFVHRPAALDWASFRPRLTTTPLPFSLPSAL